MAKKERALKEQGVPPSPGILIWILALGLVLRVYAAVSHLDISHPDEHFQTLEPASHVVFGFGWLSWEWSEGTRSWLVPALYMPLLAIFKGLGFQGGVVPIAACRVLMALLSTCTLYQFWVLLKESAFKRGASLIALSVFALSPACVAWGAMTLSDLWAMIFLWCSLPAVLRAIHSNRSLIAAGALLGLSFLMRIQMVLWPIGMVLVLMFRRPFPWKIVVRLAAGYTIVILFQGVLDWTTWGAPFHSVIANIQKNLFEHVASFYGTSPYYEYFESVPRQLGWILTAAVLGVAAIAVSARRARFRERDALVLVPAILYILVHSAIAHKEIRFMFPLVPAVFYLLAWALSAFEFRWKLNERMFAAGLLLAAIGSSEFVYSNDHTYMFDLSELTRRIREDGGLKNGGCLILLDHYWIWTRGEMMIGAKIHYVELSSSRPLPSEARSCVYAISLPGREAWFKQPGGPEWTELERDEHGQTLMKRISD